MQLFDNYSIYIMFWVGLFGLCLGSFFNVVILRSLTNESIISPPSKCPKCGNRLLWWHNIPVISYLILRGKCWFCKEKISLQYPLVELLTMGIFVWLYCRDGLSLEFFFMCIVCSLLLIMTTTDIKERVADCKLAIALAIVGVIYNFVCSAMNGLYSILGLLAGAAIIAIYARIGKAIAKKDVMGDADTYVVGAIGACFGIYNILSILLYSLFASMIFILPMYLYKQCQNKKWTSCIFLLLFCISIALYVFEYSYFAVAALFVTGIGLAISILKEYSADSNTGTYAPFIPALALGTLLYIYLI